MDVGVPGTTRFWKSGVGESQLAAIHQHTLSQILELPHQRSRLRVEEIPECGSVRPRHHLHRDQSLVIVRPTVVFGEGNRGNVYNLLRQISTGKFTMVGQGKNKKSMAYVGNIAAFLAHCLTMGPGVHIYNYVDGPDKSTAELVEHIWHCLGRQGRPARMPKVLAMAAGHGFDLLARVSGKRFPISAIRVRKFCESTQFRADRIVETGFQAPYTLAEGLARTIEHEFPAMRSGGRD